MSGLAKAFAGLKQAPDPEPQSNADTLGTRVPRNPGTQEPRRPGTQVPRQQGMQLESRVDPIPAEKPAKRSNPDYTPVKVFLRRKTHKAAARKWQDEQERTGSEGDFSDLMEQLLGRYLGT